MTGNVALDVVIGLVFIFLLYSLLSSVVAELIATFLGLRARNLHKGVARMLEEQAPGLIPAVPNFPLLDKVVDVINIIVDFVRNLFTKKLRATQQFYEHPSVKFLARDKFFSKPSYIPGSTFSKVLLDLIKKGQSGTEDQMIAAGLNNLINTEAFLQNLPAQLAAANPDYAAIKTELAALNTVQNPHFTELLTQISTELDASTPNVAAIQKAVATHGKGDFISGETLAQIKSFLDDAAYDAIKFKAAVENWFTTTMDRVSGWYKRQNHLVLLIIGFFLAAQFNASTIEIVSILSKDDNAREQMVQLAGTYVDNNQDVIARIQTTNADSLTAEDIQAFNTKMDSLLAIKKQLNEDMDKADDILGFHLPDSILVSKIAPADVDSVRKHLASNQRILGGATSYLINFKNEYTALQAAKYYSLKFYTKDCAKLKRNAGDVVSSTAGTYVYQDKRAYFWDHFWGYLLTALAVSLGATFWFDTLNKLVKLRSSVQSDGSTPPPAPTK